MESSVDLFERQMATSQRVIKFRKTKGRRSSWLIISLDIPSQVILNSTGCFQLDLCIFCGEKKNCFSPTRLAGPQNPLSRRQILSCWIFPFSENLICQIDEILMIGKSRNAQKRKFAQRDAWDHWDCANPLHTHLTSSQHQSPPGFEAFQERKWEGRGDDIKHYMWFGEEDSVGWGGFLLTGEKEGGSCGDLLPTGNKWVNISVWRDAASGCCTKTKSGSLNLGEKVRIPVSGVSLRKKGKTDWEMSGKKQRTDSYLCFVLHSRAP